MCRPAWPQWRSQPGSEPCARRRASLWESAITNSTRRTPRSWPQHRRRLSRIDEAGRTTTSSAWPTSSRRVDDSSRSGPRCSRRTRGTQGVTYHKSWTTHRSAWSRRIGTMGAQARRRPSPALGRLDQADGGGALPGSSSRSVFPGEPDQPGGGEDRTKVRVLAESRAVRRATEDYVPSSTTTSSRWPRPGGRGGGAPVRARMHR